MNNPIWIQQSDLKVSKQLSASIETTICIVGSGISALYTAYLLAKRGIQVTVIEADNFLGGTATRRSTGKLTAQHGAIYSKLPISERSLYYHLNYLAIEKVKQLLQSKQFEYVTSYLYSNTAQGADQLKSELNAYKDLPFHAIATEQLELNIPIRLAIGMPNMYQINPVLFTQELVRLARNEGVEFYTNTRATTVDVANKCIKTQRGFTITCQHLILCTHYPIQSLSNIRTAALHINRSYLSASKVPDKLTAQYLCIDAKAERTIRTTTINNETYLIYGGGNHIAGTVKQTTTFYDQLKSELISLFDIQHPIALWSSQDIQTADAYPYVGQLNKHDDFLFIATGFNKWGLSNSLVAGEILEALIFKLKHAGVELFSPQRKDYAKQLLYFLTQSGFVAEELIKGYVQRRNAPKCTHLGCKTNWNEADRTWDCPCHGSRFHADGHVLEGPAVYPLQFK